ncbi:MAG: TolB family protein [Betaproteobacteria bacterium]
MKDWKHYRALGFAALLVVFVHAGVAGEVVSSATDTFSGRGRGAAERKGDEAKNGVIQPTQAPPAEASSGETGTAQIAEEKKLEAIEPLSVRPLVTIESGRNDSNPLWSPGGGFIAFERSVGDKKEIHIVLPDGTPVQTIYHLISGGGSETRFFFPGLSDETSYNAGMAWSPDDLRFVFMSNGGEGNYDLYLQDLGAETAVRLTNHKEKDGQAHWSPVADRIVFVSGRTGKGDVYVADLKTYAHTRLTRGGSTYLYPRWSPDGMKIVMMRGSNENHDIVLINDPAKPVGSQKTLTTWPFDDLRPVWSPDGKKIAFYSNYNAAGDPKLWSLVVVSADGSDPTEGDGLAAKVAASDVIPDVEVGPGWMPDSRRIVFVKNDRQEYNPIYVADIKQKTVAPIKTDTRMNHDVTISADGTIAFRAQVNQWDQIYVMKLRD